MPSRKVSGLALKIAKLKAWEKEEEEEEGWQRARFVLLSLEIEISNEAIV